MGNFLANLRDQLLEPLLWILIIALYVAHSGNLTLGQPNEIFFIQPARELLDSHTWTIPLFNGMPYLTYPPLLSWLILLSFKVFHVSIWAAKLPSVVLGLGGLLVIHWLSLTMFRNHMAAFLSSLLMAGSWGYFWLSHSAMPTVAYVLLLQLVCWFFIRWHQLAARPKLYQWDKLLLCVALGIGLGLLFLLKGTVGLLVPLVIFGLFIVLTGSLEALLGFDWIRCVLPFLLIALPWPLWVSWHEHDPAFFFTFLFHFPPSELLSSQGTPLLKSLCIDLFPWNLFFIAAVMDVKWFHKTWRSDRASLLFLFIWLIVGGIAGLLTGGSTVGAFLLIYPPVFLLVGLYLTGISGTTDFYERILDVIILVLLITSMISAFLIFQILPDEYPGNFWTLPGVAVISKFHIVKEFQLPGVFPVWKLWLLPIPLMSLIWGLLLYYKTRTERSHEAPMYLVALSLLSVVFYSFVLLPIFNRPITVAFGDAINRQVADENRDVPLKQRAPYDVFIVPQGEPALMRLPFFLEKNPSQGMLPRFWYVAEMGDLNRVLSRAVPGHKIFEVMDERSYYGLMTSLRLRSRVLAHYWKWCDLPQDSVACWVPYHGVQGDFRGMTSEVLLLELLPPSENQS